MTVIDDARGWVLEQHLYDSTSQLLASAVATGFQFDPLTGVSLPRFVEIRLPASQLHFTLQTEQHLINQLRGDPTQLWSMPQPPGSPLVNLARPAPLSQAPSPAVAARPPARVAFRSDDQARNAAIRRLPPFDRYR